jgi:hypothetical protein
LFGAAQSADVAASGATIPTELVTGTVFAVKSAETLGAQQAVANIAAAVVSSTYRNLSPALGT